jgi:hypothetical protein
MDFQSLSPLKMTALVLLAITSLALATPSPVVRDDGAGPGFVHPANGDCVDYTILTNVTFPSLTYVYPIWKDDHDVAAFLFNMSTKDAAKGSFQPYGSTVNNVTTTYSISATFCSPKSKNGKENTVLVATHGGGYDRRCVRALCRLNRLQFHFIYTIYGSLLTFSQILGFQLPTREVQFRPGCIGCRVLHFLL